MDDLKSVLERGLRGFEPSDDAFERTLRRRDRKRRNQRITAGVVGIAVLRGGGLDHHERLVVGSVGPGRSWFEDRTGGDRTTTRSCFSSAGGRGAPRAVQRPFEMAVGTLGRGGQDQSAVRDP